MRRFAGKTVLIADDDSLFREVLCDLLGSEGARVLEASDAEEAWSRLQGLPVDAVVSDFRMPRGGGLKLLDRFREVNLSVPFALFLTGNQELDRGGALDRGADLVLSKPFDGMEWMDSLLRQLGPFHGVQPLQCTPQNCREFSPILPGRRGVFLPGTFTPTGIREGEKIEFEGPTTGPGRMKGGARIRGQGIVRWVRECGSSGAPGVGIEVLALEPDCWAAWMDPARTRGLRASIPLGV